MAIQKHFILRYRDEGHVRFQIPALFCEISTAKALTTALLKIDGIYRVDINRNGKKLSIRYQETLCDFKCLAKQLFDIVAELVKKPAPVPALAKPTNQLLTKLSEKIKNSTPSLWFKEKLGDAKETVEAAKILTKGLSKNKSLIDNPGKFATDFFNDVLALYLIKLHWEQITKQWIPNPIKYRYEWLAVSYLLYLLMRSRNPKP